MRKIYDNILSMEIKFMQLALELAQKAAKRGEVPIGAVIVHEGKVIAKATNKRERSRSALWHAEMLAIAKACKRLKNWRLTGCDMYVTLEPCEMCLGAARNARIRHVYYGAPTENLTLNHELEMTGGILATESSSILKNFFQSRRNSK